MATSKSSKRKSSQRRTSVKKSKSVKGKSTKRKSAKKTSAKSKRTSSKRELISPRGDKRYVRRNPNGQIEESDDQTRSLSQDRRRKAKKRVRAGQGDRGDR